MHNQNYSKQGVFFADWTVLNTSVLNQIYNYLIQSEAKIVIAHDELAPANKIVSALVAKLQQGQKQFEVINKFTKVQIQFWLRDQQLPGIAFFSGEGGKNSLTMSIFDKTGEEVHTYDFLDNLESGEPITILSDLSANNITADISAKYLEHLTQQVRTLKAPNLTLVVDTANANISEQLLKILSAFNYTQLITVNQEAYELFVHHEANINPLNVKQIAPVLQKHHADLGLVFDCMGNYLIVDEQSKVITQDVLTKLLTHLKIENGDSMVSLLHILNFIAESNQKPSVTLHSFGHSAHQPEELDPAELHTTKEQFNELLQNFWYTWNPHYILPIINLYGDGWRKNLPPQEFIAQYGPKKLHNLLTEKNWEIAQSHRLYKDYMDKDTWFSHIKEDNELKELQILQTNPVAYFCMEYGLVDWLQIYSGGLGVLAGDFLKQASDMGVPVVGIGLFYHQGYFHQDFDADGTQVETYLDQDPQDYPLSLVTDSSGIPMEVTVEIGGHNVFVRAWRAAVGKTELFLLDTNFDRNQEWKDRMITAHLYGGNEDTRIRQEIVLGIGGARLLQKLNIKPSIYHMNEGHSGFLVYELAREHVGAGKSYDEAIKLASHNLVFTNHTLKQAGNDIFPYALIQEHLGSYVDDLNTSLDDIYRQGKEDLYAMGGFSMTILGLRNAKISNAVSQLHGKAAKRIWPEYQLVPITNGAHMLTWVAPEIHQLLDKYVSEKWHDPMVETDFSRVRNIPQDELWEAHNVRKKKLITSLNQELSLDLDEFALTIAWSRRLASYKRPDMIISDLERLAKLVNIAGQPLQIIIAGKSHPKDVVGKEILHKMNKALSESRFHNKVVILPGYNWQLARRMVSGADIWLNTPYRFEEASGTSGMKAAANGVIQLTTKDGWTDEVDWYQKGWVIPEEDADKALHNIIEFQVLPLFFERNAGHYNSFWVEMMQNSMELVLQNYSTERMMLDYLRRIYLPIITGKEPT